jgi:hypothetical protein
VTHDYAECTLSVFYVEYHNSVYKLNAIMLNVIMLNVIMLNVIMLSVIMLSVIILNANMLSVVRLNVLAPTLVQGTSCFFSLNLCLFKQIKIVLAFNQERCCQLAFCLKYYIETAHFYIAID